MPSGVLSDFDIEREVAKTESLIEGHDRNNIQASCYDLTVGYVVSGRTGIASGYGFPDSPSQGWRLWAQLPRLWSRLRLRAGHAIAGSAIIRVPSGDILPGEVVTVVSKEVLNLPMNITGLVIPKDKPAQKGLLILNAGHVDPGWQGAITAQVVNLNKLPVELAAGDSVFSVIFEYLEHPATRKPALPKNTIARNRDIYGAMLQRQSLLSIEDLRSEFVTRVGLGTAMFVTIAPVVAVFAGLATLGSFLLNLMGFEVRLFDVVRSTQIATATPTIPVLPTPTATAVQSILGP